MVDVVDPATRSRMMAGIRAKDTAPELQIRRGLHRLGFRFRLHDKRLPGKPDLLLPKHSAVIFVHGCFWHGHDCPAFKWPKTRAEFWRSKIKHNRENDRRHVKMLRGLGWRVCVIWECSVRKPGAEALVARIARWLAGTLRTLEIRA
ncbi:MAG: DNA mismatch endonuclease Vsr [Betaproteobacteria bacterium]|nr:DNA mismatch endonuclease Vsr [Betaproteobacteria bacterium]